jgi:hypothetical protein
VRLALLVQLKGLSAITRELATHALSGSESLSPRASPTIPAATPNQQHLLKTSLEFLNKLTADELFGTARDLAAGDPSDSQANPQSPDRSEYSHIPSLDPAPLLSPGDPEPLASAESSPAELKGKSHPPVFSGAASPRVQEKWMVSTEPRHAAQGLKVQPPGSARVPFLRVGELMASPELALAARGLKAQPPVSRGVGSPGLRRTRLRQRSWLQRRRQQGSPRASKASTSLPSLTSGTRPEERGVKPSGGSEISIEAKAIREARTSLERAFSNDSATSSHIDSVAASHLTRKPDRPHTPHTSDVSSPAAAPLQPQLSTWGNLWRGVASSAAALRDSARIVPSYHPFGFQLYVTPEGISVGLNASSPSRPTSPQNRVPSPEPADAAGGVGDLPAELGQDVPHEVAEIVDRGASSMAQGAAIFSGPTAASAANGQAGRREVFHMHRMFNYRHRLLALLNSMGLFQEGESSAAALLRPAQPPLVYEGETAQLEEPPPAIASLHNDVVPPPLLSSAVMQVIPTLFKVPVGSRGPLPGPFRGGLGWVQSAVLRRPARAAPLDSPPVATQPDPPLNLPNPAPTQTPLTVYVSGHHLPFVTSGLLSLGTSSDVPARVFSTAAPEDATIELQAEASWAAVRCLAARPAAVSPVTLHTDFGSASVDARVEVRQCMVVGSAAPATVAAMQLLHEQALRSTRAGGQGVPGAGRGGASGARRPAWATALRPLQFIQRLRGGRGSAEATAGGPNAKGKPGTQDPGQRRQWLRSQKSHLHRSGSGGAGSVEFAEREEAPPVVLCGGVRYLDLGWDASAGRALDTHATQAMWDLACRLGPAPPLQRKNGLQAWVALLDALPSLLATLPGLIAAQAAAAHSAAVSTWQRLASAATASTHMFHDGSMRHVRAIADLQSRPLPLSAVVCADDSEDKDCTGDRSAPAAPPLVQNEVRQRMPPQWRRWRPGRGRKRRSSRTSAEADSTLYSPADFISPAARGSPAERPQVDAVLVVEDVQSWSTASSKGPLPRRRAALSDFVSKAQARGAATVLVITVPPDLDDASSRLLQWSEHVAQIKASYGLQSGVPVVAVPVPVVTDEPKAPAIANVAAISVHNAQRARASVHAGISVHNAVASVLLEGIRSKFPNQQHLSSKL